MNRLFLTILNLAKLQIYGEKKSETKLFNFLSTHKLGRGILKLKKNYEFIKSSMTIYILLHLRRKGSKKLENYILCNIRKVSKSF